MKTESRIKEMLKKTEKDLKETEKQFKKYDNHDDMETIQQLKAEVQAYKWVLSDLK